MAVIINNPRSVFVHIPKTGGSSVQKWLLDNTDSYVAKSSKHHDLNSLEKKYGKFNFSFTIVRNPWDWCVSWYFFRRDRALRRIQNPKDKGKFSLEYNQYVLSEFEKGFDYFIETTQLLQQCNKTTGVDYIIKLENINTDIQVIANKFDITCPIPVINQSRRDRDYKLYYNTKTKDMVYKKFKDDINTFNYVFD